MAFEKLLAASASLAFVYVLLSATGHPVASTLGLAVGLTVLCLPARAATPDAADAIDEEA